jgi:hypothetical protein
MAAHRDEEALLVSRLYAGGAVARLAALQRLRALAADVTRKTALRRVGAVEALVELLKAEPDDALHAAGAPPDALSALAAAVEALLCLVAGDPDNRARHAVSPLPFIPSSRSCASVGPSSAKRSKALQDS